MKLESRPQMSVKVRLREMCDWKLSGLCTVDNMTISFCQKRGINQKRRDWVNETLILELIFCDPQWQTICCKKWHPDTLGISKPPEIAVETQFHVQHSIKTTLVFLPTVITLLVAAFKFGLLTIRWDTASRKHLFLYPRGDRSGLR